MNAPIAYGIDFGTTNSAVAVAYTDHVEVLPIEEQVPASQLPSIVYLHREGIESAGMEAVRNYLTTGSRKTRCGNCPLVLRDRDGASSDCRQYRPGSGCNDSRFISGLKQYLSDPDFRQTHSWARNFELPDLLAVILSRLKRAADRACGANVRRLVVGHPVNFPGTEGDQYKDLQQLALDRLVEAAGRAGFVDVATFPEPAAALLDEKLERGTVLAVDFGGGTFDCAIVRFANDEGVVIALQGADIGGELFDAALFERKVAPYMDLDKEVRTSTGTARIPAWMRKELRTMAGARFMLNDPAVPAILRQLKGDSTTDRFGMLEEILFGGHIYDFYRAVEAAKIALSNESRTIIELHRPGIDISIPLTRAEFEEAIQQHLNTIRDVIERTLQQAHLTPKEVDLVIRTGGSSSIPAFENVLADMFTQQRVQARDPFDSVAHGLGSQAQVLWAS